MSPGPHKSLVVSIHDVTPAHAQRLDEAWQLVRELGIDRGVLLVVPDYHGRWPLDAHPRFAERVREWVASGWEVALHGYTHLDDAPRPPATWRERLSTRYMTAGEGEFLLIDRPEAARRIAAGRELLGRVLGTDPVGFVPPAWLCGPGGERALGESGLAYSEDHLFIADLRGGRRLFCPALGWASRSRPRRWLSRFGAATLTPPLARLSAARLALHPGDFGHDCLVRSIRRSFAQFLGRGFSPATNLELLDSASFSAN